MPFLYQTADVNVSSLVSQYLCLVRLEFLLHEAADPEFFIHLLQHLGLNNTGTELYVNREDYTVCKCKYIFQNHSGTVIFAYTKVWK